MKTKPVDQQEGNGTSIAEVVNVATIKGIYISKSSTAPMESKQTAMLLPGRGIHGDRYATSTGTYSAQFLLEPGRNLTMISLTGVKEAMERTGMTPPFDDDDIGAELRRNLILDGIYHMKH